MPYCKYCGNEVDDDYVYCKKCGKKINISDNINNIKTIEKKPNPKIINENSVKKNLPFNGKNLILLLGIIVIIAIISATIWIFFVNSAESITVEADKLYNLGNYNEALDKYSEALEINPEYEPAIDGKFNTLLSLGDDASLNDCIYYYNSAQDLKPESVEPILREGKKWEDSGNYKDAINFYTAALSEVGNDDTITERLYAICDAHRPVTGTFSKTWVDGGLSYGMISLWSNKNNQVTFDNSLGNNDCIVIMKNSNDQASVYVRKGEKYTLNYVPSSIFYVYTTSGEHYNPVSHEFLKNAIYYKIDGYFDFDESGYNVLWDLTLYAVKGGDVKRDYISKSSFPDIA